MKKSMILLGMLSIGYAYAQEGRVGINTDTPKATLNVKSKTGTTATTKNVELENANGTKMVTVLDNGHIGIGTDKPDARVHILSEGTPGASGPRGSNDWIYDYYENGTTSTSDPTGMYFRRYGGKIGALSNIRNNTVIGEFVYEGYYADALKTISNIRTTYTGDGTTATARLHMGILGSNTDLVINRDTDGGTTNIGIGTNAPTQKLDVNGNVRVRNLPANIGANTDKIVVVDNTGVLKSVDRSTMNEVKATTTGETCSDTNLGAIHFKEMEIDGKKAGTFGFCTKQDGVAMWVYLMNGGNILQGTGVFGSGL